MQREELGGWCMIAGAVLGLLTMAFHPTGTDQPLLLARVHSLGLLSLPIAFYGGFVLTQRLSARGPIPELALTFHGLAIVAGLLAAAASGLMAPALATPSAEPGSIPGLVDAGILSYNHIINQSFAKLLVAASSVAIALWSMAMVHPGGRSRALGILGCAVGVATLLALFSGQLRMDVHGFGAVVIAQAVWFILVGTELRRVGSRLRMEGPGN